MWPGILGVLKNKTWESNMEEHQKYPKETYNQRQWHGEYHKSISNGNALTERFPTSSTQKGWEPMF